MSWFQVLGGNSDIGFTTVKIFAKNKYNIHLISRDINNLKTKKNIIEKNYSVQCKISEIDLMRESSIDEFFNKYEIKPKVILIAAGYLEKNEKNIDRIININFKSLVTFLEKTINKNIQDNFLETIIGISSVSGDRRKKNSTYSISKSDFSNYLSNLNQRLYKSNINVITVKPGYVETKMTKDLKLPKLLVSTPQKIAKDIYKSFNKKKIIYTPFYWRQIMFIYKLIPNSILKFLNF